MASRMIASRFSATATQRFAAQQTRSLSSQGTIAVERLREALEEYRATNYSQCLPSRFRKDIIAAATNDGKQQQIAVDGIQRVISNIRMEHKVSHDDVKTIFQEIGGSSETISKERFMQMIA